MTTTERIEFIKDRLAKMKEQHENDEWQAGDNFLFELADNGHLHWLVEQVEKSI